MTDGENTLPVEAAGLLDYWFGELDQETWWKSTPAHRCRDSQAIFASLRDYRARWIAEGLAG